MKLKVSAIIEARMSSSRLPGKVLKKINNKEILKMIIERVQSSKKINKIVVATTTDKEDDKIVSFLKKIKIPYYRGSVNNLLQRIINCAEKFKINNILRITGDNPLTDYFLIDHLISYFENNRKFDYITNNHFADKDKRIIAYGLDLSLFSLKSLKQVKKLSKKDSVFQEYPTLYFHTKGGKKFKTTNINYPKKLIIGSKYRLTVDTVQDLKFFKKLFNEYFKSYKKNDYMYLSRLNNILKKNPSLVKLNQDIVQFIPTSNS
ncbi:hypothetical protein N8938_01525 [Candidatus Pelagibacter sp.]|nr:hypothetical protein [Candidatus Pelagibacter sp.]